MLAKSETRQRTAYGDATSLAVESCRNRRTVALLGLEDFFLERFRKAVQLPYKEGLTSTLFTNVLLAFSISVTYFVYALAYWW